MTATCDYCGNDYQPVQRHQRFCSRKCKDAFWRPNKYERHKREQDKKRSVLFGALTKRCDAYCPHWQRCRYQAGLPGKAEDILIGCMVPVEDLAHWASQIDAQPSFQEWLADRRRV